MDQQLDDPWPIEVYDHNGRAHNVTMQPGEMCLYESHTVLHGRPTFMNGDRYANVFVHFKPLRHDDTNKADYDEDRSAPANKWDKHETGNHDAASFRRHMQTIRNEDLDEKEDSSERQFDQRQFDKLKGDAAAQLR